MKTKIYIIELLLLILLMPIISASVISLPTQKQYSCIDLPQVCSTCTYVNVSSIKYPNSSMNNININMTKIGSDFNYNFCDTDLLGKYLVTTCGDKDGFYQCAIYDFIITPTGEDRVNSLGIFLILVLFSLIILVLGTIMKNGYVGFISGALFIMSGAYSMMYGIGNLADMWTRSIAFVLIGLGLMLIISAGINIIGDTGFGISKKDSDEDF